MTRHLRRFAGADLHVGLMLALTLSTGINDAVGYLGLDRVFTGNMTGNVVVLGMALVGADKLPVVGPALALVGFMAGAAIGGRVLRRSGAGWTPRVTGLFGAVAAVMVGAGAGLAVVGDPPRAFAISVTTVLGAAMGMQAATARFIAVKDVTTVVVTSTITGLAADSWFGSGKGTGDSGRRVLAIVLILSGAAVGAALTRWHLPAGLIVAGIVTSAVATWGGLAAASSH